MTPVAAVVNLEVLRGKFPDNESIASVYARGLSALLTVQSEDKESTLQKLEALVQQFPDSKAIKTYYDISRRKLSMREKIKGYSKYPKSTAELQKNILSSQEKIEM
nr:hypothetical protein [uncultured Solibaculum sp.]